jgi:capsid protein
MTRKEYTAKVVAKMLENAIDEMCQTLLPDYLEKEDWTEAEFIAADEAMWEDVKAALVVEVAELTK